DGGPQDAQRLGGGRCRNRHLRRLVETEAGMLNDIGDRMPGMHAREREAPPLSVEGEQAATGNERDGTPPTKKLVPLRPPAPDEKTLPALRPGGVIKSTFSTGVGRLCWSRNRITLGTT